MRAAVAGLTFVMLASMTLSAQNTLAQTNTAAPKTDRLTFDVAGGMSRHGPHAFGGLEMAMNRWLALRGEALFGLHQRRDWPSYRQTALSLTSVLTYNREARVTPYLLGGLTASVSQGYQPAVGPLAGAGLRVKLGRFEPFLEARAHRTLGVPISLGIRF